MRTHKNLTFLGTSHIAEQSINEIVETFNTTTPDIICVELDKKRLHGLLTDQKPDYSLHGIRKYGLQGYLFAIIGAIIQKKLGNIVGVKPGSDMLAAVNLARTNNKKLELIDQDIEITLKRFSKAFSLKEKIMLLWDVLRSPFGERIKLNLREVPSEDLTQKLISQLKRNYPSLHAVLIDERNIVMAKNIYRIMTRNPESKILVVVGAGHLEDLIRLVKAENNKRDRIR